MTLAKVLAIVGSIAILSGCNTVKTIPEQAISCPAERPQMCTMDYQPVCGHKRDKGHKTYSNHCSACAHTDVAYTVKGECSAIEKVPEKDSGKSQY